MEFYFLVFSCQCHCNRLPVKTCLQNDLLCVEWDVEPTRSHSLLNMWPSIIMLCYVIAKIFLLSNMLRNAVTRLCISEDSAEGSSPPWFHGDDGLPASSADGLRGVQTNQADDGRSWRRRQNQVRCVFGLYWILISKANNFLYDRMYQFLLVTKQACSYCFVISCKSLVFSVRWVYHSSVHLLFRNSCGSVIKVINSD